MKSLSIYILLLIISVTVEAQDVSTNVQNDLNDSSSFPNAKGQTSYIPTVKNIKPGEIIFPNAFKWNGTGPTGGFWSDNNIDDCVFRPFQDNVTNYKLKIFTRQGTLIYESTDINKGWDGYTRTGNLAVQGVYVWMASGKFSDGAQFSKIGDVTFLH